MEENKNLNNQPTKEEEKKKKKCGFLVWWHKLSKGAKIGISAAAGVALVSAIVFPTLAATVWNNKAITIKFSPIENAFVATNIKLDKGRKYNFSLDVNEIQTTELDTTSAFSILTSDYQRKTKEIAYDFKLKSNLNEFKRESDRDTSGKDLNSHEYCYVTQYNRFDVGKNSFSKTENTIIGSFVASDSLTDAFIAFSFE